MAGMGAVGFMVEQAAVQATAAGRVRAVVEDRMVEAEERVPRAPVREAEAEGDRITE